MAAPKSARVKRAMKAMTTKTTRANLSIDTDALKRLEVYCTMTEQSKSDVLRDLINTHLKRFRVSDLEREPLATVPAETNDRLEIEGRERELQAA